MYKVMIDAGHGGSDVGATGNGLIEKEVNLKVARFLDAFLRAYDIDARMTRYQDSSVSLGDRCKVANLHQANVFISIHHNASGVGATGYEIYHATGSIQGSKLAVLVATEFDKLGQSKRYVGSGLYAGSKQGDYYVLKNTAMPAILTEFAFLDSIDYHTINNDDKLLQQAEAIGKGILAYFGIKEKEQAQTESLDKSYKNCVDLVCSQLKLNSPEYWYEYKDCYVKTLIVKMANRLYELTDK